MKKLINKSLVVFMALIFFIMSSGFFVFEHFCENCEELEYHALFHNHNNHQQCDIAAHDHSEDGLNCCSIHNPNEQNDTDKCSQVLVKFDYKTITSDKQDIDINIDFPILFLNSVLIKSFYEFDYSFVNNYKPPPKYLDILDASCIMLV